MVDEIGVNVITEQRFIASKGEIFAEAVGGRDFWLRYLDVFPWVKIISRVHEVTKIPGSAVPLTDKRIRVAALPSYYGPREMLLNFPKLWSSTRKIAADEAAFILRVPGMIGTLIYWHLHQRQWPYAVEVVGDPYDSLSQQAIGSSWARVVRPLAVRGLQRQCQNASAASYVTASTLQKRYPTQAEFVTHYSSIDLQDQLIKMAQSENCQDRRQKSKVVSNLIFVGSLSQRYKGLHILLHALRICQSRNLRFNLHVLGDGSYRQEYERLANELNLDDLVYFHGYVKQGEEVFQNLCQADLFVMPSLMEGLPRAMIEAMACGLPCIGSKIGGIPELLNPEDMVPPADETALAEKIMGFLNDPQRMKKAGIRNREIALQYRSDVLRPRRQQMYRTLREITVKHRESLRPDKVKEIA